MPQPQSLRGAEERCPRVFLRCDLAFLLQFGCRTNHAHLLQSMVSSSSGNQAIHTVPSVVHATCSWEWSSHLMVCWQVQWLQMLFPLCGFPSAAGLATGTSVQMGPGEAFIYPALDSLLSPFPDLKLPANQAAMVVFTLPLAKWLNAKLSTNPAAFVPSWPCGPEQKPPLGSPR